MQREFADVIQVPNQLTLREIILSNLGGPDLISWKALGANLVIPREERNYFLRQL